MITKDREQAHTQAEWLTTRQFLEANPSVGKRTLYSMREELGAVLLGKTLYWRRDAIARYAERQRGEAE